MSYTRRDFVDGAFAEVGSATYSFDLPAEILEEARRRLDRMMASWNAGGIRIGWPMPSSADGSDLDTDTGVTDMAFEAITANLALRVAPLLGKQVSGETRAAARESKNWLTALFSTPPTKQPFTVPLGAGNKPWRYPGTFTLPPEEYLATGNDGELDFS